MEASQSYLGELPRRRHVQKMYKGSRESKRRRLRLQSGNGCRKITQSRPRSALSTKPSLNVATNTSLTPLSAPSRSIADMGAARHPLIQGCLGLFQGAVW